MRVERERVGGIERDREKGQGENMPNTFALYCVVGPGVEWGDDDEDCPLS